MIGRRLCTGCSALLGLLFVVGARASAQDREDGASRVRLVARLDAFVARVDALHAGLGATTALGSYVRLDAVLAAGAARAGDETAASGRAELVGRFLLDPFRQSRWGVYGGAGLLARYDDGPGMNAYLTLLVGAELPGARRLVPALEVGIGSGTRVALVVRRGRPNRR